jgi:hypothetical protein
MGSHGVQRNRPSCCLTTRNDLPSRVSNAFAHELSVLYGISNSEIAAMFRCCLAAARRARRRLPGSRIIVDECPALPITTLQLPFRASREVALRFGSALDY